MNMTETLLNLDIVSSVGINDKLVTEGSTFNIRPNTSLRSFVRWWNDESRLKNYVALQSLFGNAINLLHLLKLRGEDASAARVARAINPAISGVKNLAQTYRDDVDLNAKFNRLVQDVEEAMRDAALLDLDHVGDRGSETSPPAWTTSPPRSLRTERMGSEMEE